MLYLVRSKTDPTKYFNSGTSRWVNTSGYCTTPSYGPKDWAWGCTQEEDAQAVANFYDGIVEPQE